MAAISIAPRATVHRLRTETADVTDRLPQQMAYWKDAIMKTAADELSAYLEFDQIGEYIKMLTGEWWPANRPGWRSKFFDNYLADQRRESLASLSQIKPALDIKSKVKAYEGQANTCHAYARYLWSEYDLDLSIVSWIDHALFGTGMLKIVTTEGEPDQSWMFNARGLDTVIPVGCNSDVQDSACVVDRSFKRMSYFISKFGWEKCKGLERESVQLSTKMGSDPYQRPDSIPQYRWDALSPAFKRRVSMRRGPQNPSITDPDPFPVIEMLEIYSDDWSVNETGHDVLVKHPDLSLKDHNYHYIVPPGCRLFPRKRLTVFAGNRVMYDGPSPFWHGQYPYTMLQLNPCVFAPGGISKYRDLVPLVKSINRIVSGVDESVMFALNRNLVGKRGIMPEAVWDNIDPSRPNQKFLLNMIAQPSDLRYMDPPQVPQYVGDFLRYLVETVKKRSGSLDIQGLARKKQAPGGEAIEQMRETMSSPFQLEGRYVEAAVKRAGKQVVSNVFQFATVSSRLSVLGADGMTFEDFDYNAGSMVPSAAPREDHWRKFSITIAAGSTHGSSRQQKKVEAFTLRRAGDLSLKGLYTLAEVPYNYEQNVKELAQEHQAGIGVAPPKGRQPRQTRSQRNGSPV